MKSAVPSYPFNAADELCAGAAQAAALCTLVIRGAQRGLTKAVPRAAAAEHASTIRIKCGGWASPPCGGLAHEPAPVPPGHVASPDPRTVRGVRTAQEAPDPYGGSEAWLSARSFHPLETHGVSGPIPRRGTGPGPLAW